MQLDQSLAHEQGISEVNLLGLTLMVYSLLLSTTEPSPDAPTLQLTAISGYNAACLTPSTVTKKEFVLKISSKIYPLPCLAIDSNLF